jgi:hypothetical protein
MPRIKPTNQLNIASAIKKNIAATKTNIKTIIEVTVVSRFVGQTTFLTSFLIS